ncbi:MAG: hypothetical protein ACFFEE_06110, partial [Candidatus Thorarchaeota archaeon]
MGQKETDIEMELESIPEEMEEPFAPIDILRMALMGIVRFFIGLGRRIVSFVVWIKNGLVRLFRFFLDPGQNIRLSIKRLRSYGEEL